MTSGKKVLRAIDRELKKARQESAEQAGVLATSSKYLADVRNEQASAYRELGRLRLDEVREAEVSSRLSDAEKHAKKLLERHAQMLASAREEAVASERRIATLEESREKQEKAVDGALAELDAAIAATRGRLESDETYRGAEARATAAQETAVEAERKAELARADRVEKGAPYEADALFMYLWKRRFATDAYDAWPVIRSLDEWVARLCKYRDARIGYRMLNEIPLRLGEHARRWAEEAQKLEEDLAQLEEDAFLADGHGRVRDAAQAAERDLAEIDRELDEAETTHIERSKALAELSGGLDPTFREALEVVLSALQEQELTALRKDAERTPMPEDDELVDRLIELENEEGYLKGRVEIEREASSGQEKLVEDLEWVRRKFKVAKFDSTYSKFKGSDEFVHVLVSQLARGAISRDTLWTSVRSRQRTEASDAGIPLGIPWSLGRRSRRLSFPTVRGGGLGGLLSGGGFSTGGRIGGSFRTGGRIGGGGFRTGGRV